MRFPFSLKRIIVLDQSNYKITSESYILSKLEERLDQYGMTKQRISEQESFYLNMNPFRSWGIRNSLRNLKIKIETDTSRIFISLETETILVFFLGTIPLVMYPVKAIDISFTISIVACSIIWLMGYFVKLVALTQVKNDMVDRMNELK